ncbi:desulfoferrodoxin [Candidatus Woesearchaeota archaeon]|nr:desulfoferrodoxin [Candidatus Woesearchaeota archaeon]
MAKLNRFYKCNVCGNIVSVVESGAGELVCCGEPMKLIEEKGKDQEGKEKHVPVLETTEKGIIVKVGSVEHPMEEKHYIELIQLIDGDEIVGGKRLKPGEKPMAEFCMVKKQGLKARILCNVHGLWIN